MRQPSIVLAVWSALLPSTHAARAQQGGAPEPIVQVSIDPQRVVVGQPATLLIMVLAPNYMTSPPELPNFLAHNAATRQLRSMNVSEPHGDVTYAGVRFEYAIYPQEPGSYAIAGQNIKIKYAAEPPATRETSVALPAISFEAFVPAAASGLRPFVSATRLSAEQTNKRSSETLKVGDAVTRTVTVRAEGALAMLLPPKPLAAVEGLKLYPAQPVLEDKTDERTGALTATRIDAGTYMVERSGRYVLPSVDFDWWNAVSGKVERVDLDAITLDVHPGPPGGGATSSRSWTWGGIVDAVVNHWPLIVVASVVLAAMACFAPRAVRRIAAALRRRRVSYLRSEAWAFRRLGAEARTGEASGFYFAMLGWLQKFEPVARVGTVDALMSAASDPVIERQIVQLRAELFAPTGSPSVWSARKLMRHVRAVRRNIRRDRGTECASALPRDINPIGARNAPAMNRRVAR